MSRSSMSGPFYVAGVEVVDENGNIVAPLVETLAEGSMYIGDATNKTSEIDISPDGQIVIGDGTTAASTAVSGDATITNAGVVTVAALDLETATVTNITDTELMIGTGAGTANFAAVSGDATLANTGALTVTGATTSFEVTSTDPGALGAIASLYHDSASPADNDVVGRIQFQGEDDGGNKTEYAQIDGLARDVTGATEDGELAFRVIRGGSLTTQMQLHSATNGISVGDSAAAGIVRSAGDFDLTLQTGNSTTGTLTMTDGASGALTWAPDGLGKFQMTTTDDGAVGAEMILYQDSASPAAMDFIGLLNFNGNDDGANLTNYARIAGAIGDPTDGSEAGLLGFLLMNGSGSLEMSVTLSNDGSDTALEIGDGSGGAIVKTNGAYSMEIEGTDGLSFKTDGADVDIEFKFAGSDGAVVIGNARGIESSTANVSVPFVYTAATEVIAEGAGGAISVATYTTTIGADAGGDAFTLAAGSVIGQLKKIIFVSTSGGTGVVTSVFRGTDNTLTFTAAGEYAEFIWDGTDWLDITLSSYGTFATPPALTTV